MTRESDDFSFVEFLKTNSCRSTLHHTQKKNKMKREKKAIEEGERERGRKIYCLKHLIFDVVECFLCLLAFLFVFLVCE